MQHSEPCNRQMNGQMYQFLIVVCCDHRQHPHVTLLVEHYLKTKWFQYQVQHSYILCTLTAWKDQVGHGQTYLSQSYLLIHPKINRQYMGLSVGHNPYLLCRWRGLSDLKELYTTRWSFGWIRCQAQLSTDYLTEMKGIKTSISQKHGKHIDVLTSCAWTHIMHTHTHTLMGVDEALLASCPEAIFSILSLSLKNNTIKY